MNEEDKILYEKYGFIVRAGIFLGYVTSGANIAAIYAKLYTLWFLGFFMIARFATNVIFDFFPPFGNQRGTTTAFDIWNITFLALGSYLSLCFLRRIIWPRFEVESFTPTLSFDVSGWTVQTANPVLKPMEFLFPTSHPLYFFIDILCLFTAWIFIYIGMSDSPYIAGSNNNGVNFFCYWLFYAMTALALVFRQFAWFILGRKIISDAKDIREFVARPLIYLYSFLAFIAILTFIIEKFY